jgi:Bacterial SH3 domain
MIAKSTIQTRLCPKCANSIQEDAANCPYCKADLSAGPAPQWLIRDEASSESRPSSNRNKKFPIPSKFIWPAALLVVALTAFFAGGYTRRSELSLATEAHLKALQAKDQMIQSQEAQLAQTKQQLSENSNQVAEMKTKLEESLKELSAAQQRLATSTREVNRQNVSRPATVTRTASRAAYSPASYNSPAVARHTAEPGVYETTRATSVYEDPSSTSRVISQIGRGTRINVVSAAGDWLQVRSKHGNPPGYVSVGDARQVSRTN